MPKPKLWNRWQGRIIRAIVLDGAYSKEKILKTSGLTDEQFEKASKELIESDLLQTSPFFVNIEICNQYRSFFKEEQENLRAWFQDWKKNIKPNFLYTSDIQANHFYLSDKLLESLSIDLIEKSRVEILAVNPFIEECHLSNTLKDISAQGINVRLVTRSSILDKEPYQTRKQEYHSKLVKNGVSITYDESVHAKILVVDKAIAIVSSMNFNASSTGGASWEAGLVTIEPDIVSSISSSIITKWLD